MNVDQMMVEVARIVRARRTAGDFPLGLERELDAAFARFAPQGDGTVAAAEGDAVTSELARASGIDPVVSVRGGVRLEVVVKAVLRKLMRFYVAHVAGRARAFNTATVAGLGMLDERLATLEARQPAAPSASAPAPAPAPAPGRPDLRPWFPVVGELLGGARGRVLHAECGEGALLRMLLAQGVDAYGVDPASGEAPGTGPDPALDIWAEDPMHHLGSVSDGGLGGAVLSGCVDRLALVRQRRLVALAHAKLAPGARLVVISQGARAWGAVPPPDADLGGGGSLHAPTWVHLLTAEGFEQPVVHDSPASFVVSSLRP